MSSSKKPQQENNSSNGKAKGATGAATPANSSGNPKGKGDKGASKPAVERERQPAGRPRREDGGEGGQPSQRPQQPRPQRDAAGNKERPRLNPQAARNNNNGVATKEKREDATRSAATASSAAPAGAAAVTSGPVIQCKKDITAAPTWNKGGKGPSFADMVRHKASAAVAAPAPSAAQTSSAKQPPAAAQEQPAPPEASAPEEAKKAPAEQETQQQQQQQQQQQSSPKPDEKQVAAVADPEPSQAAAAAAVAIVEEEDEEEVVFIPAAAAPAAANSSAAAAPNTQPAPAEEPPAPAAPPAATYYVLEIERVDRVKLPDNVIRSAGASPGLYTFSGQAGKPPTPPVTPPVTAAPQQAIYRSDVANLGNRTGGGVPQQTSWGLSDNRVPQQQQPWHPTAGLDYWNDRSVANSLISQQSLQQQQRFPPHQPGAPVQYGSYQAPQPQQIRNHNYFQNRLRQDAMQQQQDTTGAGVRAPPMASQFGRAGAAGGGVW